MISLKWSRMDTIFILLEETMLLKEGQVAPVLTPWGRRGDHPCDTLAFTWSARRPIVWELQLGRSFPLS